MALIDAIDSYYSFVVAQMASVSSAQKLLGYVNARDWPLTTPDTAGGLYLLYLNSVEIPGGSKAQALFEHHCQWVWIIIGTDIQAAQQSENRGDRFRTNMAVQDNLRQANFPGWCQKKTYSADSQGNLSAQPVQSIYPLSNVESVMWNRLRFGPKQDNLKSGLVYGAAQLELYAYDDVLPTLPQADPAQPVYIY